MGYESLPSSRTYIVDAPEVDDFTTDFRYNFFERDERTNETGQSAPRFAKVKSAESFDAVFIGSKKLNRASARYINFSWRPINDFSGPAKAGRPLGKNIKIKDFLHKIHEEQDFMARNFSRVDFQETGRGKLVKALVKHHLEKQGVVNADKPTSPMDVVKRLKGKGNQAIDPTLLCETLIDTGDSGIFFLNGTNEVKDEGLMDSIESVKNSLAINKKCLSDVLKTSQETGHNVFQDELETVFEEALKIQEDQRHLVSSAIIDAADYDFEVVEFVGAKPVSPGGYSPNKQFLGYIIEKNEILADGTIVAKDPIIIESPNITTAIDFKVKYGATYAYTIKSVVLMESMAEDTGSPNGCFVLLQYLISSRKSTESEIRCVENTPPPPPADFNAMWAADENRLYVNWAFPVNIQQDIKQWQIFRRESIYDPFELQKVYDFNDSTLLATDDFSEFPDEQLIEKSDSPNNTYIDKEFLKDSKYIYAVCAVDAHGLTSNYSTQFEVSFDRLANKLRKKLISIGGAPKSYPNMAINRDLLVDTIKVSGAKRVRILFTPEYLKLFDSEFNDLKLLRTAKKNDNNPTSFYKMNLINVDLQQQQNIKIVVEDRRRTIEPSTPQPSMLTNHMPLRFGLKRRV
jgi:hypothetical protein